MMLLSHTLLLTFFVGDDVGFFEGEFVGCNKIIEDEIPLIEIKLMPMLTPSTYLLCGLLGWSRTDRSGCRGLLGWSRTDGSSSTGIGHHENQIVVIVP